MGKRKRVKANPNMNGNGNGEPSTSSILLKMSRGRNLILDNKIGGGGNSSKKMKGGEPLNSGDGQCQSVELSVTETSIDNLPPENANSNGEPSSSSSYWTRSRKEAPYPGTGVLDLSTNRKIDTNDSSNLSSDQGKVVDEDDVVIEGPITELPPEMLRKILKNVHTLSLFKCRLVSRQWLEISNEILISRTDSIINFGNVYDKYRVEITNPCQTRKSLKLQKFVESMKNCNNVPYARFSFQVQGPSLFFEREWSGFLSIFAPSNPKQNPNQIQNQRTNIKRLEFTWSLIYNKNYLLLFIEKLNDLLVNKFPRLEELALDFSSCRDAKNVRFFLPPKIKKLTKKEKKRKGKATVPPLVPDPVPVQLPYLKILKIEASMFFNFPEMVEDLLNAAVNLTQVHVDPPERHEGDSPTHIFQFLHSLGKLHLLKEVKINVDQSFLSDVKKSTTQDKHSNFFLGFKVEKLKIYAFAHNIDPPFYADCTNFISNFLELNKDTMEKLKISPLGFLHELQFPKFTKLRTLNTYQWDDDDWDDWDGRCNELRGPLFPPGIRSISRSREIFPAVDNLNLKGVDWSSAFPQEDSIPIFPRVHTFCFEDEVLKENVITQLGLMCPNLKHCKIQTLEGNPKDFNFPQIGRSIWIHLNQLESLEVDVDVNLQNHAFPALDSCFTGISMENCQRLQELMEAEKTRNENSSQVKLPESEEIMKLTKREHPSILDMKNLKTLTMNTFEGETRIEGKHFFTTKITWISEEFAFKLMPHLEFNGRKPSTSC